MAALPETTVVGEQGEGKKKGCSVCLEVYKAGDTLRTMPCSHAFHGGCILGWLAVSRLCPLCRFALPPQVESDSETDVQDGDDGEVEDSSSDEEVEDSDDDNVTAGPTGTGLFIPESCSASSIVRTGNTTTPPIRTLKRICRLDSSHALSYLMQRTYQRFFLLGQQRATKMDGDGDASPAADEQPRPEEEEPLPAEATDSSTEQYPGDMHHFPYVQILMMHRHLLLHSPAFPAGQDAAAYTPVMQGVTRDGILAWYDANGGYRDGGFGGVPASDEAIAALPETTVGEAETRGQGKECAVCLEAYEAGDTLRTMPCSHGFHERCIFPWLQVSRLGPLCRFALPAAVETASDMNDENDGAGNGEDEEEPDASDS